MEMGGWSGRIRNRLVLLFWLFAFLYALLVGRLAHVQHFHSQKYAALAREQQEADVLIPAVRGDIRDSNNAVLASSLALNSVAVNPSEIKDKAAVAQKLAPILGKPANKLQRILDIPCTFQWLERKVPDSMAKKVEELKLEGVFLVKEATPGRRFYPKGRLMAHLLGATGIDDQGLDGLEAAYDEYLGGQAGLVRSFMDRDGWSIPAAHQALLRKAVPGRHLVLTLDETIQYVAERELAACVKERNAKGGVCIVMDVKTGGILAMAVMPDFSAAKFADVPPALRKNRAITDGYEPGSTFKVFLAAAAVDSGVGPTERFASSGVLNIGGWTINNANDGLGAQATETLADIIKFSFNVGTANVALHIGKKKLYEHLYAFGFGQPTGIDLIGEADGILAHYKYWEDINTATISFGQGVSVTPLQLCSGLQAIANKGVRLKPHVVKAVLNPDGSVYKKFEPKEIGRPISEKSAARMIEILRGVCEKGTGKGANIPGYRVCGKTGTAQVVGNGGYREGAYTASFLGFAPQEDPRIVCLVKIEEPTPVYWGGVVAAPVFQKVAHEALWKLGVGPSHPEEILTAQQGEKHD